MPAYIRYGYKNVVWDVVLYKGPVDPKKLLVSSLDLVRVVPAESIQFDQLMKYDDVIHPGVQRSLYWRKCFEKEGVLFLVALNGNDIVGFGGIRPSKGDRFYHLCPIYADSLSTAKVLVKSLVTKTSPTRVKIETVEPNPNIKDLMNWLDIPVSYTLTRQYTGEEVSLPYDKVYGMAESDLYFV